MQQLPSFHFAWIPWILLHLKTCSSFLMAQKCSRIWRYIDFCQECTQQATLQWRRFSQKVDESHHFCHDFWVHITKFGTKDRLVDYAMVYQVRVMLFQVLNHSSLSPYHGRSSISTDREHIVQISLFHSVSLLLLHKYLLPLCFQGGLSGFTHLHKTHFLLHDRTLQRPATEHCQWCQWAPPQLRKCILHF